MVNIQTTNDNECFKWCFVRYLNPAELNPAIIRKADKNFAKRLDFKYIKVSVKIRDIYKIEKKNSIVISIFAYKKKEKHPIYVSKKYCEEKHVDLLLKGKGKKNTMSLSKVLTLSCMIIHYIVEENIFVVIVSKFLK